MDKVSSIGPDDGPQIKVLEAAAVAIAKHVAKVQREVSAELRSKPTARVPREDVAGQQREQAAQRREQTADRHSQQVRHEDDQRAALASERDGRDAAKTDEARQADAAKADATKTDAERPRTTEAEHNTGLTGEAPENRDVAPGTHLDIVA